MPSSLSSTSPLVASRPARLAAALFLSVLAMACDSEPEETAVGGASICRPDPAKIALARACRIDEHCPCGSSCRRGQCLADCQGAQDCPSGQICGRFGTCEAESPDPTRRPVESPTRTAELELPSLLRLEPRGRRPIEFAVRAGETGPLRVSAEGAFRVRCGTAGEFAGECTFSAGLAAGSKGEVYVESMVEAGAAGGPGIVRLFFGEQVASFSVLPIDTTPAPEMGLRAGRFAGEAALVASGLAETSAGLTDAAAPILSLPVRARLFLSPAGTGTLIVEDPLRVLHPSGKLIGRVASASPTQGTLTFPAYRFVDETPVFETPVEAVAELDPAPFTVVKGNLQATLDVTLTGLTLGDRVPRLRFRLGLGREGDLAPGDRVEAVPAPYASGLSVNRARSPLPWEAAVASAATPAPNSVLGRNALELRGLLGVYAGAGSRSLEACNLPTNVVDFLMQFALSDAWGAALPENPTVLRPPVQLIQSGRRVVEALARPFAAAEAVSASATLVSSRRPRDVACAARFMPVTATFAGSCGASVSQSLDLGSVDVCAAMATTYGCEVVEGAGTLQASARVSYREAGCVRSANEVPMTGQIGRVCRFPVTPSACGELASCWEGTGGSAQESVQAPVLGTARLQVAGDLRCAEGSRTFGFASDVAAELDAGNPDRLGALETLDLCRADLDVIRTAGPPTARPFGDGLAALFDDGRCVDAPRFLYALGVATDADRRRAAEPSEPVVARSSALAHRLLQRWLEHHAFLAREAAQAEVMARTFRRPGDPSPMNRPPVAATLDEALRGIALLAHPRFGSALSALPGSLLAAPDYRAVLGGGAVPSEPYHEQTRALPLTLLETLQAIFTLLDPGLETASLVRDATALETSGRALRWYLVLQPWVGDMARRAQDHVAAAGLPDPAWLPRYRGVERSLSTLIAKALASARAIARGDNPLGIEEDDLPLYFFGDEEGPNGRFSAISDFLIGAGANTLAWAPVVVQRAADALTSARARFVANLERDVRVRQTDANVNERLDALRQKFGDDLATICGAPSDLQTRDLLERWRPFNENNCFVALQSPTCAFDVDAYISLLSREQVEYHMCTVRELRRAVGFTVGFADEVLNQLADALESCVPTYPVDCPGGEFGCLRCMTRTGELIGRVTPDTFRAIAGLDVVPSRAVEDAQTACLARYEGVDPRLPSPDDVPNSPTNRSECYRGTLGETALAIRGAQQDIEIARRELTDLYDAYDIQMRTCLIQQVGNDRIAAAIEAHNQTMTTLGGAKLAADIAAAAAGAVKDCADSLDVVDNVLTGGAKSALLCTAAGVEAAALSTSAGLQFAIDEAERSHELTLQGIQADIDEQACFNDAELALVGIQTAGLRIERAITDLDVERVRFNDLKIAARAIFDDGNGLLEATRGRRVAPLAHDLWIDEAVELYGREMRRARRIVYLAVRAVEYETQQTLALRDAVLAAAGPSELRAVLDDLWASAGTRGINGRRPTQLKVVLSLRRQLLQLGDQSWLSESEQRLTDVERFRLLLTHPRYATFDAQGTYLGQRIPFELAPLGAIALGEAGGIPVLAGADCAERVWSVNASVQGSGELFRGDDPSFVQIQLRKRNSFYSQWCTDGREGFQLASVRPSRNLFRDPRAGGSFGDTLGISEIELDTPARIEAYLGVDRATFESDAYANGETSELAARGLYGAYALFFPAQILSRDGGPGLRLENVDDVLLRLDYVSVAR